MVRIEVFRQLRGFIFIFCCWVEILLKRFDFIFKKLVKVIEMCMWYKALKRLLTNYHKNNQFK